ncbi:BrnT family toxin [bacterium]|nr:BrnT family toxin [bacterium]
MIIRNVIISERIQEKLWSKHHVDDFEVEEVFSNYPYFEFRERGKVISDEDMYSAWGRTNSGRYLIVFFIYKLNQDALIMSARDMNKNERKHYAKARH